MTIDFPRNFNSVIEGKRLLLDTSFFIDFLIHRKKFERLIEGVRRIDAIPITIQPVVIEFSKGLPTKSALYDRVKLIEELIDSYLPITGDILDLAKELIIRYGVEGSRISLTDLLLGAITMKYRQNLLLVTKNLSDFPTSIFDRKTYFLLHHPKAIQSYGVFGFNG